MELAAPLSGTRVIDQTLNVAGGYCAKLLADAGADIVLLDPWEGSPLRSQSSGALFEYLHGGARSVARDDDLQQGADVVVTDRPDEAVRMHRQLPDLVVVAITPFGIDGPWSGRPATEFTLQAASGSTGRRGLPEQPPVAAGGRLGEWISGTYAAVAALAALRTGRGELIDIAMLDCMTISMATYPSVFAEMTGWPPVAGTGRIIEVPSILPTSDGWAVVTTNSRTQFHDFLLQMGRSDLLADTGLANAGERFARRDEFLAAVHEYSTKRSTSEVLEDSSLLRIPSAPVLDSKSILEFEQFAARQVFVRSASGRFHQPRPPYRIAGFQWAGPKPAPEPGRDVVHWSARPRQSPSDHQLPLQGIRVLDCTAWWAGPAAAGVLGSLGADVVKIESVTRPDLMRYTAVKTQTDDRWWEWGPVYHGANTNKRGITLDLSTQVGVDLFERLLKTADVVIENYAPRVFEQFGLGWDRIHEVNPSTVFVRMPAFGLDGPWRDRTGFAQTMEAVAGLAWITGFVDGPPILVGGICDPLAGMHAVLATLLALRQRDRSGAGTLVEVAMVESALNVSVESLIEFDLYGKVLQRLGNRSADAAPQGVYRCSGSDQWVALAVATDDQWAALCGAINEPSWATDARFAAVEGRRLAHDEIDGRLSEWFELRNAETAVRTLSSAGVPAEVVVPARETARNPQLRFRGLFETEEHEVTGSIEVPTMPFRFASVASWLRRPSPTLGQHNDEVLIEVADEEELKHLRASGAIGNTPLGA